MARHTGNWIRAIVSGIVSTRSKVSACPYSTERRRTTGPGQWPVKINNPRIDPRIKIVPSGVIVAE